MKRALALALLAWPWLAAAPEPAAAQVTSIPPAPPVTSIAPAPPATTVPGRVPDAIDQARERALAPIPQAPGLPAPGERWVPERRFYSTEFGREIVIPGHYETRITDQQYRVPPLTGYGPRGEGPVFIPGGERPPADLRQGP